MTTAHRPTFDPARGKEALRGPAYHQRLLPAHTQLKYRKLGQGGDADDDESTRDLAAELLAAEAVHNQKKSGRLPLASDVVDEGEDDEDETHTLATAFRRKRIHGQAQPSSEEEETLQEKRRRILAETRDIDADDSAEEDDSDLDDSDDDDDDDAELQRELERVRKEREEKHKKEEAERLMAEAEAKERNIALGNPLLNKQDFTMKRQWDDDVVFKNQARGTEDRNKKKEFVNDLLRSDFHRRFMSKYVR